MRLLRVLSTSVGQKLLMAGSGLFLILFVLVHLAGNLQIFAGRDAVNDYAVLLHSMPKVLWALRIALIAAFVTHIVTSVRLAMANRHARGDQPYQQRRVRASSLAARTMMLAGVTLLAFIVLHVCHLTWGVIYPEHAVLLDSQGRPDVYARVVLGFGDWRLVSAYVVAQMALAMHLSHGFSSAPHTLGVNAVGCVAVRRVGAVIAWGIAALYLSIPAAVQLGMVQP